VRSEIPERSGLQQLGERPELTGPPSAPLGKARERREEKPLDDLRRRWEQQNNHVSVVGGKHCRLEQPTRSPADLGCATEI